MNTVEIACTGLGESGLASVVYRSPPDAQDPLQLLVDDAIKALKASIRQVHYLDDFCSRDFEDQWRTRYKELDFSNKLLLAELTGRGGVYALLTAEPTSDWTLKYVGQVDANGVRQRIRSHLIWRNKNTPSGKSTGSKFDEIASSVMSGQHIGFSFVAIKPESLRHFVEGELHRKFHPSWNSHGTTAKGQRSSSHECTWHRDE